MLPIELYEAVLDQLEDDKHSLAMCSRANRTLLDIAQHRLFADIRLDFDSQATNLESRPYQLLSALETSPHLGSYVRRFTVSCESDSLLVITYLLPPILEHLSALRFFSGRNVFRRTLSVKALERATKHLLQLPTLEQVCLHMTVDFPFHLIRTPSLRHLVLTDAGETGSSPLWAAEQSPLKLRTLKLCSSQSVVQSRALLWLQSAQINLSDLQALMLDIQWMDVATAQKLLRVSAGTLQLLALAPHSTDDRVTYEFLDLLAQPPFCWKSLRTLVIYTARLSGSYGLCLPSCDDHQLGSLDAALSERKDMYPALQDVIILPCAPFGEISWHESRALAVDEERWWRFREPIDIRMRNRWQKFVADQHSNWKTSFPKCAEAGMLRDTPSTDIDA
ncbi:uncharacterized protein SCHCODRAFT_02637313 [Schizophyllum commune H4-8]|nr:uncharacterized protein SCHCODRAFT_02637313 [Schizophyllum commune H4-8]KAI5888650.1 hypothetical protein SCHCODRAFT_02637313 [Schizophyllum commune H4-8]